MEVCAVKEHMRSKRAFDKARLQLNRSRSTARGCGSPDGFGVEGFGR
jgi:hypothetical protein